MKIGFIGTGNMGSAVIKGYLARHPEKAKEILAFDADADKLEALRRETGIGAGSGIEDVVTRCDVIVLGVKPDQYDAVLPRAAAAYDCRKVLISMAAGVSLSYIERFAGGGAKVIRVMPNTPALVGEGMTAVCRNANISEEDARAALSLFCSVGTAREVPEELIHCVIGVSGSSPAYTYLYIEALAAAAARNGMEKGQAIVFAAQAVLGAAKMVLETGIDPAKLRENVCSSGGTTIEAVRELRENGFAEKVQEGFQAAVEKSKKMTR